MTLSSLLPSSLLVPFVQAKRAADVRKLHPRPDASTVTRRPIGSPIATTYELPHLEEELHTAWHAVASSGVAGVEDLSRDAFLESLRRSRMDALRLARIHATNRG